MWSRDQVLELEKLVLIPIHPLYSSRTTSQCLSGQICKMGAIIIEYDAWPIVGADLVTAAVKSRFAFFLFIPSPLPSFLPQLRFHEPSPSEPPGKLFHYDQSLANLLNLFALFSLHCTCLQNSQTCLNLALYQLYVCTQVAEHG